MKLISQPSRELRLMVRCLELYYRQARPQKAIARALGVSAATVSRLLKRAYDEGFVRVELDLPRAEELEAALTEAFGLREAVVVAAGGRADLKEELGAAAAAYFEKIASNGIRVGLSCGFTLYQTIRQLRERRFRDLALYPLSGESTLKMVDLSPNTLVGMMAAKYRPHVSAYALPVQHLLSLREIERERRRLLRDPEIRSIYEAAQTVDIALVGIGMIAEQTPGFCSLAESYGVSVKRLRQLGVVGEINYQPFDAGGRIVDRPELRALMHRILSAEGSRLQTLSLRPDRHVVAGAGGRPEPDAHRRGRLGSLRGVAPEDRRAPLRRDHRVDRVLEHEDPIAHPDRERAPATALPRDDGDDGRTEGGHLAEVPCDRLRLAPLLGADAGVRAGRVDEAEDRLAELLGELHEAERLAIALGVRHAEVARDLLTRVAPLLVVDDDDPLPLEPRQATDDRRVVPVEPVAVELDEVLEEEPDEVARVGALGVAGELRPLPGGQARVGLLALPVEPLLELRDLLAAAGRVVLGLERRDPVLQLEQGLLEIKRVRHTPP